MNPKWRDLSTAPLFQCRLSFDSEDRLIWTEVFRQITAARCFGKSNCGILYTGDEVKFVSNASRDAPDGFGLARDREACPRALPVNSRIERAGCSGLDGRSMVTFLAVQQRTPEAGQADNPGIHDASSHRSAFSRHTASLAALLKDYF